MWGMIRDILHAAGQRIKRTLEADRIQTLSLAQPEHAPDLMPVVRDLLERLTTKEGAEDIRRREVMDFMGELQEAALMGGAGPWLGPMTFNEAAKPGGLGKSEAQAVRTLESFANAQGANGIWELEMSNWEWRRETSFGWLEFSRWGIQQIILISRLYYIKNPIPRRLVDVCAIYVFGRGVEASSPDPDANEQMKRFRERNQKVLGQVALTDLERRKDYDGNLFFVFFTDKDTGESDVRTIDATEVQDIVTDPEDCDTEHYFRRQWVQRNFDETSGKFATVQMECWYPALDYEPAVKPTKINGKDVMWDNPVYHRKCGTVGKWMFGCPRIYPMLDWAKAARKFLEACAAVKAALAQISMQITTKGGQQALAGIKQQLETTVNTGNGSAFDRNPTATNGSIWASGPGTTLAAFKSSGEGGNPDEVKRYLHMCCMVKGVPPTFLGDLEASAFATATSLDRPTELGFMLLQEEWREDLGVIYRYDLRKAAKAPNSKFREALEKRKTDFKVLSISEARRERNKSGDWRYIEAEPQKDAIEVTVTFPAIREGDIPELSKALAEAWKTGTMDAKATNLKYSEYFDIEGGQELNEEMYPEGEYDPNKANQQAADDERAANAAKAAAALKTEPGAKTATVESALTRLAAAFDKLREPKK